MAEIELSVLARQCLERRIPDQETLKQEVAAWEQRRNQGNHTKSDYQSMCKMKLEKRKKFNAKNSLFSQSFKFG
ncbi:hypothetical protein H1P_1950010 [Hyella patelloides LEGE 07179]|uniref:Uncharacterized protein n=1 Tax=Hyella patelloides LEGE 07179 TaxID=945734 RepID=A0A563VPL1_9CYAN|nr:hypothetical protein H1P_1950010 [Hyella patelloides LEGE 07179]